MKENILILGGTSDSHRLVRQLSSPLRFNLIISYLGLTSLAENPFEKMDDVTLRQGGFGGVRGLIDYIKSAKIRAIIDLTHPYAVQMKNHSFQASQSVRIPYLNYLRPCWTPDPDDDWLSIGDKDEVLERLPLQAKVFWAAGRHLPNPIETRPDIMLYHRKIMQADGLPLIHAHQNIIPLPLETGAIGQKHWQREQELFTKLQITDLVTKNSGGEEGFGKIMAARHLNLNIWMLTRPKYSDELQRFSVDNLSEIVKFIEKL